MPPRIFIDGQAGTTALRIRDWLAGRDDLEFIVAPEELRKDPIARQKVFASVIWSKGGLLTLRVRVATYQ